MAVVKAGKYGLETSAITSGLTFRKKPAVEDQSLTYRKGGGEGGGSEWGL